MKTRRADRRAWLVGLALATLALPVWSLELSELMAQLAQRTSGEVRFTEQRFVSGLDQPLRASGTLSFQAPDRLARHTLLPRAESFVVEGKRITLERGGRTRQTSIDTLPELAAMVAAMRSTLTGDLATLRQHFQTRVAGSPAQWSLTLVPMDERVATTVRELRIDGRHGDLRQIEIHLTDGDRSVMSIDAPAGTPQRAVTP